MKFTQEQYQEVISNLESAKGQLEPNGRDCAICSDSDHQAWECPHNPLNWKDAAIIFSAKVEVLTRALEKTISAFDSISHTKNNSVRDAFDNMIKTMAGAD